MSADFDVIVLGGGPAGEHCAGGLAGPGRVAVGDATYSASGVVIATGSDAVIRLSPCLRTRLASLASVRSGRARRPRRARRTPP